MKQQKQHIKLRHWLKYFLINAALLLSIITYAQEPKFRHFDVEDGLPSATVYQVYQDNANFLWFSTEAGLARFDGVHFENFSMDDGLPDNEIFGLFEDNQERLWVRTFNGKFAYIKNNKIYNSSNTPFLKKLQQNHWIISIFEGSDGAVYFALKEDGFSILKGETAKKINIGAFFKALPTSFHNKQPDHHYIPFTNHKSAYERLTVIGFREDSEKNIHIFTNLGEYLLKGTTVELLHSFQEPLAAIFYANDSTIIGKGAEKEAVYSYSKEKGFQEVISQKTLNIESNLILSFMGKSDNLWVGSLGDGLYLVHDYQHKPTIISHYLKDKSVAFFLRDREGNYWVTTLGEGVFMLPNNKVITYTTKDGLSANDLYAIAGHPKKGIFVGTSAGKVNQITRKGQIKTYDTHLKGRSYNRLNAITLHKNEIWAGTDEGLKVFGSKLKFDSRSVKTLAYDNNRYMYIGTNTNLIKISPSGNRHRIWGNRTNAVLPVENGTAWIGSNNGLYWFDGKKVIFQGEKIPLFNYRVSDLALTKDSILCICTHGNGVILKQNKHLKQISKKDGLVSNLCRSIFVDDKGFVWVATNSGISKFSIEALEAKVTVSYTEADNLASNDVRGIYVQNGQVWAATSLGLSYFEENKTSEKTPPPPIYITSVKIWGNDTTIQKTYHLPYNLNNIKIEYTGLSFKSGSQVKYQYRMEGIDDQWIETHNNTAQYPTLEPGNYTFKVKAKSIDQVSSLKSATIKFTIYPPWWKTTWFILSSILLGLGLTVLLSYLVIKNNEDKNQLRRQISESERMALRSQMNPHFVFNALNSIQHFITMEDEMSANYYLSQFSKLIRRVFENSKETFISLENEITTLKLYLELEALRFEGKFNYKIILDEHIDTYDVELPSMILQPFVENAIWHGLMPKQNGSPQLKVEFEQTNDHLICIVKDNGVGRKAAGAVNKSNLSEHKSSGISNTTRRLQLLSKMEKKQASVDITDLMDDEGKALGTLVSIKIPILGKYINEM